jgi:hypothetical protein
MNIVKQTTGNVVLTDTAGNILKVFVNVNALDIVNSNELIIKYGYNQWTSLFANQIDNTQVEPAAAIPFNGNAYDLATLLSANFFFEVSGGSQNLASVLNIGNISGPNSIIFDEFYGLIFDNNSRLQEGTIDAGLGGNNGIAQICGLGYELKWEGGVLYVMGSSGNLIRQSLYNFNNVPTSSDDNTKGYQIGSLWTLDNGNTYVCNDASTGSAIWAIKFFINPIEIQAAASDETTALTAGTAKVTFRLPAAFTLTGVRASLTTAQTSGSIFTVDINLGGTSVLSTKLTIDNTEKTSVTATTPAVISNTTMTDDGEITVDIDQIGNGTAKGLKITLIGFR